MVFEIVNTILLICLLIITSRISKKINIIITKPKPLSEHIIDCDNYDNYDNYDNFYNYNDYNCKQQKTGPQKPKQPPPPIPYEIPCEIPSHINIVDMQENNELSPTITEITEETK
jgi:hypothetical protein